MKRRNQSIDWLDVAAAVGDGAVVDWQHIEAQSTPADRHLAGHLHLLERIATLHARLPPVAAFERSLHDSLLPHTGATGAPVTGPPAKWGPLTIVEKIGSGTYADVYRARDPRLDRPVALKLLRHRDANDAALESEAIEEARLLARIRHPNVVTVYGAERIDGRAGIWMELVDGQTLEQELRERGPFAVEALVSVGTALCGAVGAVHRAGLLHRDVKAQNVMRDRDGRVLLTDFGTGREVSQMTATRELAGTPLYLAPEVLGGGAASVASDVYSLGVLLYHLATGSFPVSGRSLRDLGDAHARGAHVPLKEARPDLTDRLALAIDRAAATDVARRYQSTAAFETALVGAADSRMSTQQVWWRQTWLVATAAAAIVVTLLAFTLKGWWGRGPGVSPRKLTTTQLTFNLSEPIALITAAAISPDGKYLAYADTTGLTVKTVLTGELRRISSQIGIDSVAWLPDSTSFLVAGPGGVWRTSVLADSPRKIAEDGGGISVSPDGLHVALAVAHGSIRLMTTDGGDARDVVSQEPGVDISRATWSPDGRRIAYSSLQSQRGGPQKVTIETRRLDGGEATVVASVDRFRSMVWTPDGRILIARPLPPPGNGRYDDLWEIRVDAATGQALSGLTPVWQPPQPPHFNFLQPSLTVDGKRLVFLLNRYSGAVFAAEFDPKSVELRGLRRAVLPDIEPYPSSWTPQGDAILFQFSRDRRSVIYRLELDRGAPQEFVARPDGNVLQAVVSPDTAWVFYLYRVPATPGTNVMRVRAGGGTPDLLFTVSSPRSWLRCARVPANVCVVAESTGRDLRLTSFDPVQGKIGSRFSLPLTKFEQSWDLSSDGTEIVSLDASVPDSIRPVLLDLGSRRVQTLKPESWTGAEFVAWSADGKGWIVTRPLGRAGSEVLYIDRHGQSKLLFNSTTQRLSRPIVSPEGRIAFASWQVLSTVWILTGF